MKEIISVLIPTFNLNSKFKEIVSIYSTHPKVKIIVSDDSRDIKIQKEIKKICKQKKITYYKGPQTTPIKNWNFLLSYIFNKKYVRLSSRHQKIQVKLLRYLPNVLINLFLAPTASVIINKKLISNKFNENLKWYVDNEWYYRLIKDCEVKNLKISFFSKTRIMSYQTKNSITFKMKNDLERIKLHEKNLLKERKIIPNLFIDIFQKMVSFLFIFDSKLIRLQNFFR